jgi:hypothetical protein
MGLFFDIFGRATREGVVTARMTPIRVFSPGASEGHLKTDRVR